MTLPQINENEVSKARCSEMPEGDYFIFYYTGDNVSFKYWDSVNFKLVTDMVFIPDEYMMSESWEEVIIY